MKKKINVPQKDYDLLVVKHKICVAKQVAHYNKWLGPNQDVVVASKDRDPVDARTELVNGQLVLVLV